MRVERVPIRSTVRLTRDGERVRSLSVYCPFRGRSFSTDTCESCARLVTWTEDPAAEGAHIVCASEHEDTDEIRALALHIGDRMGGALEELGHRTPIGVVMDTAVTCVSGDVEVEALRQYLGQKTGRVVPVVNDQGTLLGVLATDRISPSIPPPGDSRPELRTLLSHLAPKTVSEVMTAHVMAFPESGRVHDALNAMIVERVRFLPIVADDGSVVGLVWDLDLLSWLAKAQKRTAAKANANQR